jgi:signal transduction histidine kinase
MLETVRPSFASEIPGSVSLRTPLPHIFELFRQADEAAPRSRSGLCIGLALVRNLVESHGGSVTAASAGLGKGSEFTFRLPRED